MSGREFLELDTPQRSLYLEKCKRVELIQKMLDKLPKADQNLCNYGSYFLAVNASLCGLVTNHFFRNILHVRRAAFMSALPMAVVPFISTAVIYDIFVREALFVGELNCEVCAVVRGGLIGAVVGGLYPMFLALPLNASLAARSAAAPLPGGGCNFWVGAEPSEGLVRKMSLGVLLQALTGLYLATKHHGIYVKILQQMNASRDPEELQA
ncbi:Transmembrane protein 126A [Eurypyga helias]|uniref:Transmembrane protein 126A n=1 Tax=Eurypyga helias TaxID=54383 RepID=A0A093IPA2_EURHL|nr:Transmembrane protein 126A [Eurypyga helias]